MDDSNVNEPGHMSPDEFRDEARRAVDVVADYMRRVQSLPAKPGDKAWRAA